jgi:hypothetical protein
MEKEIISKRSRSTLFGREDTGRNRENKRDQRTNGNQKYNKAAQPQISLNNKNRNGNSPNQL